MPRHKYGAQKKQFRIFTFFSIQFSFFSIYLTWIRNKHNNLSFSPITIKNFHKKLNFLRFLVVLHNSPWFLKIPKSCFLGQQTKIADDFGFYAIPPTRRCVLRCSRDSSTKNVKKNCFEVLLTTKQGVLQNSPLSPTHV